MCDVLLPPGVNQMCDVLLPPGVNQMCDVLLSPGVNQTCDVLLPLGVNQMCDVLLPPGVNPTAVKYIYHICNSNVRYYIIQGVQKFFVHLITKQKVTSNVQSVPRHSPDIY
jgi:hypothetical protein